MNVRKGVEENKESRKKQGKKKRSEKERKERRWKVRKEESKCRNKFKEEGRK